jgi:hypothetical protein
MGQSEPTRPSVNLGRKTVKIEKRTRQIQCLAVRSDAILQHPSPGFSTYHCYRHKQFDLLAICLITPVRIVEATLCVSCHFGAPDNRHKRHNRNRRVLQVKVERKQGLQRGRSAQGPPKLSDITQVIWRSRAEAQDSMAPQTAENQRVLRKNPKENLIGHESFSCGDDAFPASGVF